MKRYRWIPLLVFAVCLPSGCGRGGRVAAMVNGEVITATELDQRMTRLSPAARAALGNDRRRLLEEMVMERLLLQEARRRGLEQDSEVRQLAQEAKRQILLGRLLEISRASLPVEVTDQEISEGYESNKESFKEPETFRASHILVQTQEKAEEALKRIKGGEPFAKVAEALSADSTRVRGGDVGYFTQGQLIPEFEQACRGLNPGQMSGVVKSPLGYHVILLAERRAARQRSLEEVGDLIRRQLTVNKQQRQLEVYLQQLRAKAQVQIKEPAAPASSSKP